MICKVCWVRYTSMDVTIFFLASCILMQPFQTTNLSESGLWLIQVGGLIRDYERGCASHEKRWVERLMELRCPWRLSHNDETTWFVLHDVRELDGFAMNSGDFFQYLEMKSDKQHRCERFGMFSRNFSCVAATWADRKMFFFLVCVIVIVLFCKFLSTMSSAQKNMKRVTHRELIWDDLI